MRRGSSSPSSSANVSWASKCQPAPRTRFLTVPSFRVDEVAAAVRDAIARGAIGVDAVKHLVLCRIERRPPRLDLTLYPYLPQAQVATTAPGSYMALLTGVTS